MEHKGKNGDNGRIPLEAGSESREAELASLEGGPRVRENSPTGSCPPMEQGGSGRAEEGTPGSTSSVADPWIRQISDLCTQVTNLSLELSVLRERQAAAGKGTTIQELVPLREARRAGAEREEGASAGSGRSAGGRACLTGDLRRGSGEREEAQEGAQQAPPGHRDGPYPGGREESMVPGRLSGFSWERELPRLAKLVKHKELSPESEEQLEDAFDEWELKAKGAGIQERVLIQLLLQLGSAAVHWAVEDQELQMMEWPAVKDHLARRLFPFSSYVRDLEEQMEKVDRASELGAAIIKLSRQQRRHRVLCRRWARRNTFEDDRMKEALLRKIKADYVEPCLRLPNFYEISFADFVHHCEMVVAAAKEGRAAKGVTTRLAAVKAPPPLASEEGGGLSTPPKVLALPVGSKTPSVGARAPGEPPTCYNCGKPGHLARACPEPKARCETCGKTGHRGDSCYRGQKEGPMGTTRTGTMRMTRNGVHFELVDEATRRTFFDAMKKYIDRQDSQCARAQERAKAKRDQERRERAPTIEDIDQSPGDYPGSAPMMGAVFPSPRAAGVGGLAEEKEVGPGGHPPKKPTDSPYLDLHLFGHVVPSLLDSGAMVSLFPLDVWESLPDDVRARVPLCTPGTRPLQGLGGTFQVTAVADLPICVAGVSVLQRFFISPATTTPILGMDALACLGIRIDFASGEVFIDAERNPVEQAAELGVAPLCVSVAKASEEPKRGFLPGRGATDRELEEAAAIFDRWGAAWKNPRPGQYRATVHEIDTGPAAPVACRVRRLPMEKRKELELLLRGLLEAGAIEESTSPWAAPIVLVPKASGCLRLCIDYRGLNAVTKKDAYPLPNITELLDRLGAASIFSTLDLAAGFHQIPLALESQQKTAFITPLGLYQYRVLPFGLVNAPGTFQRAIDAAFRLFRYPDNIGVYLDDIVVFTQDSAQHLVVLEEVLQTLAGAGFFANPAKTCLFAREAKYLGFMVKAGELTPDPAQTRALKELTEPKDAAGVRRFLGLTGYFRQFVPCFSQKALPLTALLKKGVPFQWTEECRQAWQRLRDELGEPGVRLALPVAGRIYTLDTDASSHALGAVLLQEDGDGNLRPLAYASRTLTPAERNWTTREQEAYAVVWGVLHFAAYLRWQPHFLVRSDHQSLRWLWRSDNKRIIRWALLLQEYSFTLEYVKGSAQAHVDIFSRDCCRTDPQEKAGERAEAKTGVFAIDRVEDGEGDFSFPTLDQMKAAQEEECTPALMTELGLRRGRQELLEGPGGRVFVPSRMRRQIMYCFHFGRLGAHQGVNKSFARLRRMFWWPAMRDDIQEYHATCLTCARKRPLPLGSRRGHLLASHVGAIIAIDLVGPLKVRGQEVVLLTIVDHFTRYAHAIPLTAVDANAIWEALVEQWIALFGAPLHLLSDNAAVFKSRAFQERAQAYGIQKLYSFPYHPQGNGVVEGFHHFLKRALIATLRQTAWPVTRALALVLMVYRSTPHAATGETPFYLLTGMDMVLPGAQEWTPQPLPDAPGGRLDTLPAIRRQAFDQMARTAVAQEQKRKAQPQPKELPEGALVLHWLTPEERRRVSSEYGGIGNAPLWSGPCRILRKSSKYQDAYILRPLWEKGPPSCHRRERLIALPRHWGAEEVNAALYELIADLHKPPRVTRAERLRKLLDDLPPGEREEAERRAERVQKELQADDQGELKATDSTTPSDVADSLPETPPAKRRREVQCISWGELWGVLHPN